MNNEKTDFEKYWEQHGVKTSVPAMEQAFKEIAWKAWIASAEAIIARLEKKI